MICQMPGCPNEGQSLMYPDGKTITYFCDEHMGPNGFCLWCGSFYGGVESFHFGDPPYFCDDCRHDPDLFPEYEEYEIEEYDEE